MNGQSATTTDSDCRPDVPACGDRLPPCNRTCPAGENLQAWLYQTSEGRYRAAWDVIMRSNPLPATMGRACYHTCEDICNRGKLDRAVSTHAVERFLGDLAIARGWQARVVAPPSGKKVLVVGAGPAGLAAAYHLRLLGHAVTIMDAGSRAGGMLRYGIPAYRLPRPVIEAEIQRILDLGVGLECGARVEDIPAAMHEGGFDACFAAVGAHVAKRVTIPTLDPGCILDAVSLLRAVECGTVPPLGRRVVVYGGGNTALDAARTAKRLGHEVLIVYRRDRSHMPAHDFEVKETLEEGIEVRWLSTIKSLTAGQLTIQNMVLDDNGRAQPAGGRLETIPGDSLILALGQDVDSQLLQRLPGVTYGTDGVVEIDEQCMTGYAGVFAGGDMAPSARTITVSIGHGKKAAHCIDGYLRGDSCTCQPTVAPAIIARLTQWSYTTSDRATQPKLTMEQRRSTFDEVYGGLDEAAARAEAHRCLSCGNCFACDRTYGYHCGRCSQICPCGTLTLTSL